MKKERKIVHILNGNESVHATYGSFCQSFNFSSAGIFVSFAFFMQCTHTHTFFVDWMMRPSVYKTLMNSHPLSFLYHLMTDELFSPSLSPSLPLSLFLDNQLDRLPIERNYSYFVLVTVVFTLWWLQLNDKLKLFTYNYGL